MRIIFSLIIGFLASLPVCALEVENTAGSLSSKVSDCEITELKVTGTMDARDFKFISDQLDQLTSVDLSGVTIEAYENVAKPVFGAVQAYAANQIPCLSFMGKPLTSVVLPSNLKSVGYAAFSGCEELQSITLPASVDSIGAYAFSGSGLREIALKPTVKMVGEGAFSRCLSMVSAFVPGASLGENAFLGDKALTTVVLGEGVENIGDGAFCGCDAMTSIDFNDVSLKSIGAEAFAYSSLAFLEFSDNASLESVGGWTFAGSAVDRVSFPAGATLGEGVFFGAGKLVAAKLPATMTELPAYAFAGDTLFVLGNVLPDTVKMIGDYAFYNCSAFDNFNIPQNVEMIGDKAFAGTVGVTVFKANPFFVPELGDSVWAGVDQPNVNLDAPGNMIALRYAKADQWKEFHILMDYLMGDVNEDGVVDVQDITSLMNYVLGQDVSPFNTKLAELNGDGVINISDVSVLINAMTSGNDTTVRKSPKK